MTRTALEFVPPDIEGGLNSVVEDTNKIRDLSREFGIENSIDTLLIPGMITEDADRPVEMKPKMDPLDVWKAAVSELPGMHGLCTQVTAFLDQAQLERRFQELLDSGIEGIIFVGVPRTMADGEGEGVSPVDALDIFRDQVPDRGAILIPTREAEEGRFNYKCERGATFALTQLLYSGSILEFLSGFAEKHSHRPEILLSFGYVAKLESSLRMIRWLIQDPGNPVVDEEQAFIGRLADMNAKEKIALMFDLYKRVIDGVRTMGFPISLHFEAPYGFSKPAFEMFAKMLDYWSPENGNK